MFYKNCYKKAFTLAEVLVTLGVIGVVAALTIPVIIQTSEKQQWESAYKTNFSIISQATTMIMADNKGTLLGAWGGANDDQGMYEAYKPHLNLLKKCENEPPTIECFGTGYGTLDGDFSVLSSPAFGYSVILANGTSVQFMATQGAETSGNLNAVFIDTNGPKGPNRWGKDFHRIYIQISGEPVKPEGWDQAKADINDDCPANLGPSGTGKSCGVRIIKGDYAENY